MSQPPEHLPLYTEISIPGLDHARNLALILSKEDRFAPSNVTRIVRLLRRRVHAPQVRTSMSIEGDPEIEAVCREIEAHILPRADAIAGRLGGRPVRTGKTTSMCVCYRNGAYYRRHIDGLQESGGRRRLSWVYYLNTEPKRFQGGTLQLYGRNGAHASVEPAHGKMIAFLSDTLHEVTPVELQPDEFQDARFTFNGFIHDRATLRDKLRYYASLGRRTTRFVRGRLRGT